MTCCMKAAFQALRLARHNFDCARLYRLDKIACDEATSQLVQICGILEKFFKDHLSVKLVSINSINIFTVNMCNKMYNEHYTRRDFS